MAYLSLNRPDGRPLKELRHGDGSHRNRTSHQGRNIEIRDLAGDGDHWAATVISEQFRGKSRVQQHQLVYAALQPDMGGALHALALQTSVPD